MASTDKSSGKDSKKSSFLTWFLTGKKTAPATKSSSTKKSSSAFPQLTEILDTLSTVLKIKKPEADTAEVEEDIPINVDVIDLPPYRGNKIELESYWLTPPFAYVRILQDTEEGNKIIYYEVHEPKITKEEFVLLQETVKELRETITFEPDEKKASKHAFTHDDVIRILSSFKTNLSYDRKEIINYFIRRDMLGYGKLDPLMNDNGIEDITCNGSGIPIYLFHHRYTNVRTNIVYQDEELNNLISRLAQMSEKQVSLTTPVVDAALPTGARAQMTYSDVVTSHGSSFTIRKFRDEPITPLDLIRSGSYSSELLACMWLAIQNKQSVVVVGGTASGKTSTMNALSFFIPRSAKIVSIEDTREIQLPHENWLAMHTRETLSNAGASGNIDMFALLKASLRQRPEFIIVGEVRGVEAQTLFQAMNTGHTTYSTMHAGSVFEAINRLTHDPINVPPSMFSALQLMVIQGLQYREGKGIRRCLSMNELYVEGNDVKWNQLFSWDPMDDKIVGSIENSRVFKTICAKNAWNWPKLKEELRIREIELKNLAASGENFSVSELGKKIFAISER